MAASRRLIAVTAISSAIACGTVGCGASSNSGTTARTSSSPSAPVAKTSVPRYVAEVGHLHAFVKAALSRYYHSGAKGQAIEPQVRGALAAYRRAVAGLVAINPPATAVAFHRGLLAAYKTRAAQLTKVLAHSPFDSSRAAGILVGQAGQDEGNYNQVFALGQ